MAPPEGRCAIGSVNDVGGSVHGEGADAGPAESVVQEIRSAGGEAIADTHSVAEREGGQALIDTAVQAFDRVDIVINNAGILRNRPFEEKTEDAVEPVLAVHLEGAFRVTRPAWVQMIEQGYGRIVNTTSTAGLLGNPGYANYAAAEGGI